MYRLHGAIHAYGGTTVSARSTADSVISALTPAAWYRNATLVTSAGGFASEWGDYSGNSHPLQQATGTNQPAYAAGVFTFDGADNWMAATFTLNQPCTIYFLGKQITWAAFDVIFDGVAGTAKLEQRTSTPTISMNAGFASPTSTGLVLDTYNSVACVFNGASSRLHISGDATVNGNSGAGNPGGLTLAKNTTGAVFGNCALKEVIVYAAAHDEATRTSVLTSLDAL